MYIFSGDIPIAFYVQPTSEMLLLTFGQFSSEYQDYNST
jgi:hypothetical protein